MPVAVERTIGDRGSESGKKLCLVYKSRESANIFGRTIGPRLQVTGVYPRGGNRRSNHKRIDGSCASYIKFGILKPGQEFRIVDVDDLMAQPFCYVLPRPCPPFGLAELWR
jgi:hypothetical protein